MASSVKPEKKAVAKTAQRTKVAQVKKACPECPGFLVPVKFVPSQGRAVTAWGCPECRRVFRVYHGGWTVLAEGATL